MDAAGLVPAQEADRRVFLRRVFYDLSGLPPAYINVGTLDIFVDEDIEYAQRLSQAGVPVELHVYPGAFHGSNGFVAESPLSIRWAADQTAALKAAFNPDN